jgi:hypothetical protein
MIKVLADKVLGFHNGDRDKNGNLIIHKTKIGFCELPDWVEKTPYFQAAIKDGSLKPFQSSSQSEEVLKEQEKLQALRDEIKELEEKRDLLNTQKEVEEKLKGTKTKSTKE